MKAKPKELLLLVLFLVVLALFLMWWNAQRSRQEDIKKWLPPAHLILPKFEPPKVDMRPLGEVGTGEEKPKPEKVDPSDPNGKGAEKPNRTKIQQEADRLRDEWPKLWPINRETSDRMKKLLAKVTVEVAPMPREKPEPKPNP